MKFALIFRLIAFFVLIFLFIACSGGVGFNNNGWDAKLSSGGFKGSYHGGFKGGFGSGKGGGGNAGVVNTQSMNYGAKKSSPATMRPYTINGKTYYPQKVSVGYKMQGIASWYGPNFHGKKTSNGEIFNTYALTAAHKTLPMNTIVRVTNKLNGKSVIVRINDRGPFVDDRIIDMSKAGASAIDMLGRGTAPVVLEVIGFSTLANKEHFTKYAQNKTISNFQTIPKNIDETKKELKKEGFDFSEQNNDSGSFMVQIGAFKNESGANKTAKEHGKNAKVIKSSDGFFRVFVGGFQSEEEARDFKTSNNGGVIVRE